MNIRQWLDAHAPTARAALLAGTLTVGTLDLAEAMVFNGLRGVTPMQILQSIAGGFLGRATFHAGLASALLGALAHYAMIAIMLAAYGLVVAHVDWFRRRTIAGGLLYGCLLYAVMTFVVVPFSAAAEFQRPLTLAGVLNGVLCHTLLVGLPIAWFAGRMRRLPPSSDAGGKVRSAVARRVPGSLPMLIVGMTVAMLGSARAATATADFNGISRWMNSPPLTIAGLRGKVVLVDFWTSSCSNCRHTLPTLARWYADYKDRGFIIVGVHSPEFDDEKLPGTVRQAIRRFRIEYPVAMDNDFATWNAWSISVWPTKILIDANGEVLMRTIGEGHYDEIERIIRASLGLETSAKAR